MSKTEQSFCTLLTAIVCWLTVDLNRQTVRRLTWSADAHSEPEPPHRPPTDTVRYFFLIKKDTIGDGRAVFITTWWKTIPEKPWLIRWKTTRDTLD